MTRCGGTIHTDLNYDLERQLYIFMPEHFEIVDDGQRFIFYRDIIDFVFEKTEFSVLRVRKIINSLPNLVIQNGKIYGIYCKTDESLNQYEELCTSSDGSSDYDTS